MCRDQKLRIENTSSDWTRDFIPGQEIVIPLKNGEGGYVADEDTLDRLEGDGRVIARYLDVNPNGSRRDIAGITNERGNVVGLMPHPEHAVEVTHRAEHRRIDLFRWRAVVAHGRGRTMIDTVDQAATTPEVEQPYFELGLKPEEYERIREILGRRPTSSELAMYSVMWSEHCSYKSSKVHLRQFGEKAPASDALLVGIGRTLASSTSEMAGR